METSPLCGIFLVDTPARTMTTIIPDEYPTQLDDKTLEAFLSMLSDPRFCFITGYPLTPHPVSPTLPTSDQGPALGPSR